MIHQSLLYCLGLDILAPGDEEVVEPPLHHQFAIRGEMPLVAGVEPACLIEQPLQLASFEIACKQGVTAYADLPCWMQTSRPGSALPTTPAVDYRPVQTWLPISERP